MANEKRLIDYSEVRKLFNEEYVRIRQLILDGETHLDNLAEGFCSADKVIWQLPTVDAVEVVRCKDCDKSKRSHLFGSGWRFCMNNSQHHKDEHFCSYGERREGE